jgi:hypothetical protein
MTHRIGSHGVDPVGYHLREVVLDHLGLRELVTVGVWPKGAVRDAANVELGVSDVEELTAYAWPPLARPGACLPVRLIDHCYWQAWSLHRALRNANIMRTVCSATSDPGAG